MSRNVDTTMAAGLDAKRICPFFLAQLTFASETVAAWSGVGTLTWNGIDFAGVGSLANIGAVSEGTDVKADGTTVGLSGIDASFLNETLADIRMGAPAKLWWGLWDVDAQAIIGTPYLYFSGTVDKPTLQMSVETIDITLALENRLVNLQRATQRRYTAADQRRYHPTDISMNWVEILNDIALVWGSK